MPALSLTQTLHHKKQPDMRIARVVSGDIRFVLRTSTAVAGEFRLFTT
jgi:hypothetical protein